MQNLSHAEFSMKGGSVTGLNGGNNNIYVSNQTAIPDNFIFEQVDPSQDDDDSDSDTAAFGQVNQGLGFQQNATNSGLKAGKKTKGRVKIKMEFIENKLRRYTTFSKRKTGIMKKAYELSTLTGTQVMLLVASETGHVYTFATRKLQPMITSDSGKALIQTCLNSPDPPPGTTSGNVLEQRMKPSGFEETDLSCVVGDEEQAKVDTSVNLKPVFPNLTQNEQTVTPVLREVIPTSTVTQIVGQVPTYSIQATPGTLVKDTPVFSVSTKPMTINSNNATGNSTPAPSSLTMQIPLIFPQGTTLSMLQAGSQPITVAQSSQSSNVLKPTTLSQMFSAINSHTISTNQSGHMGELNTPLPVSTPSAINIMQGMTPGIVMYHTPQGVVYATPTQNIHDRTIFNFPQPATTISMTQADQSTGQQIITIPVPVSLSNTPLLQLATSIENPGESAQVVQPPPLKKSKK